MKKPAFPASALLAVSAMAHLHGDTVTLAAPDALSFSSFNTAGNWSNALPPAPEHDYVVEIVRLRTPTASADHTFAGGSLTIGTATGLLSYKTVGSFVITVPDLVLAGGMIDHLQGATETFTLAGNLLVTGTGSRITATQGPVVIASAISGGGDLALNGGNASFRTTLAGQSTLTGNITVNGFARLGDTGSLRFVVGSGGASNTISGAGTIEFDGTFEIDLTGATAAAGEQWTLVSGATLNESYGPNFNIPGFTPDGQLWHSDSTDHVFAASAGVLLVPGGDSDGDGLDDLWEFTHFGHLGYGPDDDPDSDYATNLEEFEANTLPNDHFSFPDADNDGMADAWEIYYFGSTAALPFEDEDGDEFFNIDEFYANTDPDDPDWTPVQAKLRHRWSFNGDLADSVGDSDAAIIDPDGNAMTGGGATLSSSDILLGGGDRATSSYVELGSGLLQGRKTPVTIQLWATQVGVRNWSRIFDFGGSTTSNLFMSWSNGTNVNSDRVGWRDLADSATDNTNQPYTPGSEYHIIMTIEPGAGIGSGTLVTWYSAPVGAESLGPPRGSFTTDNQLAFLNDAFNWLGRSQYPDAVANARYNEVRIWDGALTFEEREIYHFGGPDVIDQTDSDGDGLPDDWEIANFRENDSETIEAILAKYDGADDPDGDLFDNLAEFQANTDPNDIFSSPDTDLDGLPDGYEVFWFRESPEETLLEIIAKFSGMDDPDGDRFSNLEERAAGTDPTDPAFTPIDTDGDGLVDSWEMFHFLDLDEIATGDPDGDLANNLAEQNAGSDPNDPASTPTDTDGDGITDSESAIKPYTSDSATLHLWHLDEVKAPAADAGSDPLALTALSNGAVLWAPSYPGFGTGLDPSAGRATAAGGVLSALPLADGPADDTTLTYAGPDGAFTFEAIVRIDFDPAAPANPGTPMQIVAGEGDTGANRVWQFRLIPTAGAPVLQFINLNGEVDVATFSADIPTEGTHAIAQGNWYHVAVTYNGSENTPDNLIHYWTSLSPASTQANPIGNFQMATDLITASPDFTIGNEGRATGGSTDSFAGVIDEVRISAIARGPAGFLFGSAAGDSDGDGLDDAWEMTYFGSLDQDGTGDFDNDGTDNLTEFRLGLIPNDGSSRFAATIVTDGTITWPSALGVTFTIELSTTLSGAWTVLNPSFAGTAGTATFTDPAPPPGKAFYRVRLNP